MQTLKISYSEDMLVATGSTPAQLESEFRLLLAVKLFEIGRLSLGRASEIARLPPRPWAYCHVAESPTPGRRGGGLEEGDGELAGVDDLPAADLPLFFAPAVEP